MTRLNVGNIRHPDASADSISLDSSARVGIGTSSPDSILAIAGTGSDAATRITITDGSGVAEVNGRSGNLVLDSDAANAVSGSFMRFKVDNSEAFRIDSSGRLLVGTSSSSVAGIAVFQGYPGGASNQGIVYIQTGATNPTTNAHLANLKFSDAAGSVGAQILAKVESTWASGDYPGRLEFYTTADGESSPTERIRIDSSGSVGIGVSPETDRILSIGDGTDDVLVNFKSGTSQYVLLDFGDTDNIAAGRIAYFNNTNAMTFRTNGSGEDMRIDSSGRVGIGTSSPTALLDVVGAAKLRGSTSYNADETAFFLGGGGSIQSKTAIITDPVGSYGRNTLLFCQNNATDNTNATSSDAALAITSSGNVGIGTTSPTDPLHIVGSGSQAILRFHATTYGTASSDGAFIGIKDQLFDIWQKESSDVRIGTGNTERVRILSGGGITFNGDTAAANALDDYEEGTWTPTYVSSGASFTYSSNTGGSYVKIGRLVFCRGTIRTDSISGGSSGNQVHIGGLPFTVNNNNSTESGYSGLHVFLASNNTFAGDYPESGQTAPSTTTCILYYRTSANGASNSLKYGDLATGTSKNFIKFNVMYEV